MPTTATAAVIRTAGAPFSLETIELDDLRPDEILVRIQASGVCHTDMIAQSLTPLPVVLGHEGTGVVEALGKGVTRVHRGDRVIISYPFCGRCPNCIEGKAHICRHSNALSFSGLRLDQSRTITCSGEAIYGAFFQQSSFSTHAITLERDVVVITENTPAPMLAALPCGVLTGAGAVLNSLGVRPGQSLAIFGAGAVGLSAVMAGHLVGASPLIAVDVIEERLRLARDVGATHALDARSGDTPRRIREIASHGLDYALETSSQLQSFNDAVQSLGMGGVCGIVTPPQNGEPVAFAPRALLARGACLQGILLGSAQPGTFLPRLLDLHRQGRFPFDRLIRTYPFEQINTAFEDSRRGRTIKPVLVME